MWSLLLKRLSVMGTLNTLMPHQTLVQQGQNGYYFTRYIIKFGFSRQYFRFLPIRLWAVSRPTDLSSLQCEPMSKFITNVDKSHRQRDSQVANLDR